MKNSNAAVIGATAESAGKVNGSKSGAGVWQRIINQIPPHDLFVEAFAGSAAITRYKRPAAATIVIDADARVYAALRQKFQRDKTILGNVRVVRADAIAWLEQNRGNFNRHTVVYADPPYMLATRRDKTDRYYTVDLLNHAPLLGVLTRLTTQGVNCLISGRPHPLYDKTLASWRRIDYQTATHGGPCVDSLWCNFDEPEALHDYRWLGENFRQRENLKRKLARWRKRLAAMPILERRLVAAALGSCADGARHPDPLGKSADAS